MKFGVVLDFWFKEIDQSFWFKKDEGFDTEISRRFLGLYEKIVKGETSEWRATPQGRLAEIIVLDQFSRNMFRDTPQSFAADPLALKLAQEAVRYGDDQRLPIQQRNFIYMPYMHSEKLAVHIEAVKLFSQPGLENNLKFELRHKDIIEKFGRFPHRNAILGRNTSPEEAEFLQKPGSSF
jgi:uncharacterized protein (DUF924 family)